MLFSLSGFITLLFLLAFLCALLYTFKPNWWSPTNWLGMCLVFLCLAWLLLRGPILIN